MSALGQAAVEARAREANSPARWDALWLDPSSAGWRAEALGPVYDRIAELIPRALPDAEAWKHAALVVDLGGGQGDLMARLADHGHQREVWDHSTAALDRAALRCRGGLIRVQHVDLEDPGTARALRVDAQMRAARTYTGQVWVTATEALEHLSAAARDRLLATAAGCARGFLCSVPHDRLGPDEEPQHTVRFTALGLLELLRRFWPADRCRVECLGSYLLGVAGPAFVKRFTLTLTLPVRDEGADLGKTLASFRGVADEIVVGVDPRTKDDTREVAARFAERVFELEDPACQDPGNPLHDPSVPESGCHFAWVRNQCMERATGDWTFMTEGHESLMAGRDVLLKLDQLRTPDGKQPDVVIVARQGNRQRWGFPWLCRTDPRHRYVRSTHNTLEYPPGAVVVRVGDVVTLHERDHRNAAARADQRAAQNRRSLLDDWERAANLNSLFYLGQELRGDDPLEAERYLELFLAQPGGAGLARYQARLMLAKILELRARAPGTEPAEKRRAHERAREVLLGATADDWSRTEHWLWLGDLAFYDDQLEQALQFYRYAGTLVGEAPLGPWWVDLDMYGYLPAQRLAMCLSHLGRGPEALEWARRVERELPEEAPEWAREEAARNAAQLEEALAELAAAQAGSPG